MSLAAGIRLGPYEIVSPIGAGGMGEVYRARDHRLGRDVAVKVLPAHIATDLQARARFEREAKTLAALSHPHIVAIHDVGAEGETVFVVMELLAGETLGSRLRAGPMSWREAAKTGGAIAEGLAAAHAGGIVHRDLKPDNVFITKDGRIKILDFGLARSRAPVSEEAETASVISAKTDPGTVMGTVGYMAPEQVRGETVDHRADLFAFGAILYEMLAGARAFKRDSAVETLNAILKEEPENLLERKAGLPSAMERIVGRCLEKNPARRFQSAGDLGFALDAMSGISGISGASAAAARMSAPRRPRWQWLVAAAILLAAFAGVFLLGLRRGDRPPPSYQLLTFRRGMISNARFAPDGETVIYSATWEGNFPALFATQAGRPESRPLELPAGELLSISSSGELAIALRAHDSNLPGTLAQAPLTGGAPRELLENVSSADWSPDGKEMAIVRVRDGKSRLEYPIGHLLHESTGWISQPRVSRSGDRVAFIQHPSSGDDTGQLMRVDRQGKLTPMSGMADSMFGVAWSADDREIWYTAAAAGTSRSLFAVNTPNQPRLIARVTGSLNLMDISRAGRVLLAHETLRLAINVLAPGETQEKDLSWFDLSYLQDLSGDGRTILFDESGEGGGRGYSVYLRKTDRSPAIRIADGEAGALSPDGKWAVTKPHDALTRCMIVPTGPGERLTLKNPAGLEYHRAAWFPDNHRLVFSGNEPGHKLRLYVQDAFSGAPPVPMTPEGAVGGGSRPVVAPDGATVAAINTGGQPVFFPVAGGAPRTVNGVESQANLIRWSRDGRALFYYTTLNRSTARIYRYEMAAQKQTLWKEFTPADPAGLMAILRFSLADDEKSYAYSHLRQLSELYLADGLH